MLSIKTKLLISYTIVFGILIVGYSIYIYHRMQSTALGQLDDRIVLFADRFNSELDEKIRHHGILTENEEYSPFIEHTQSCNNKNNVLKLKFKGNLSRL